MRTTWMVFLAALAAARLLPTTASAQSSDPEEGSPPGVIYEIPVESGRDDAAPSRGDRGSQRGGSRGSGRGGSRGGSGSGGGSGSAGDSGGAGVGSSSGGSGGGAGGSGGGDDSGDGGSADSSGGASGASTSGASDGTDRDGSPLRSENGFGSSSQVPGLDGPASSGTRDLSTTADEGGLGPAARSASSRSAWSPRPGSVSRRAVWAPMADRPNRTAHPRPPLGISTSFGERTHVVNHHTTPRRGHQ